MSPERARQIAQECADLWYGGAAGMNLKEALFQGIMESCAEERHAALTEAADVAINNKSMNPRDREFIYEWLIALRDRGPR